jgi:hypothetical protein
LKARGLIPLPIHPSLSELGPPSAPLKPVGRARLTLVKTRFARVANVGRAQLALMKTLLAALANRGRGQLPLAETPLACEPVPLSQSVQARGVDLLTPQALPLPIPPVPLCAHHLSVVPRAPVVIPPPTPLRLGLYAQPEQKRHTD